MLNRGRCNRSPDGWGRWMGAPSGESQAGRKRKGDFSFSDQRAQELKKEERQNRKRGWGELASVFCACVCINHMRPRTFETVNYSPSILELQMGRFATCGAQLVGCCVKMTERVCTRGIRDWQGGIYSSGSESWRWNGSPGGVCFFYFECHATPTLVDWLLPPIDYWQSFSSRPISGRKGTPCLAFLSVVHRRQIFLIVKKYSAAPRGSLRQGRIICILLFMLPLSLLRL